MEDRPSARGSWVPCSSLEKRLSFLNHLFYEIVVDIEVVGLIFIDEGADDDLSLGFDVSIFWISEIADHAFTLVVAHLN